MSQQPSRSQTPPAFARALLWRLLPVDDRRVIVSDLDDEFAHMTAARSRWSARAWYWRQVIASVPSAVTLRARLHRRGLGGDLRYGARQLRRNPAFAAAATLTLMLGIGATAAVISIANAVLLQPLPYREPGRVMSVIEFDRQRAGGANVSWRDFLAYQQQNRAFTAIAGYNGGSRTLLIPGRDAERVPIASVTGAFFDVLGVTPQLGRAITDEDTKPGAAAAVMLTDAAWRRRFNADPSVIGSAINLNGASVTVIGILPADFEFPPRGAADLWLPLRPSQAQSDRSYFHWLSAIARLKPDATVEQGTADLDRIASSLASTDAQFHPHSGARVTPLSDVIVGDVRPILLIIGAAAVLVLLVSCANIAGMLLARGAARQTEIAVRLALGANRSQLIRQLLAESAVLALPGGLLGLSAAHWSVRAFVNSLPAAQRIALPNLHHLGLNAAAVAVGLGLTVAATLIFGLVPALRTARSANTASRGTVSGSTRDMRLQSSLIAVQVALALALMFGAVQMTISMRRLLDVPLGFSTDGLVTMTMNLSGQRYGDAKAVSAFHDDLLTRITALPGVRAAATIDQPALMGAGNTGAFTVAGRADARSQPVLIRSVSEKYFDVMGTQLLAGRRVDRNDTPSSPPVAVVNKLLSDSMFNGAALGQRIAFPFVNNDQPIEIVGIVTDERFDALDASLQPVVYFPYSQGPSGAFNLVLRTSQPSGAAALVRAEVARIDNALPVYGATTMTELMNSSESVFRRRIVLVLMAAFGGIAVLLAAIGLYGVLSQTVAQRAREIGVRLALGANTSHVMRTILHRGLSATAVGLALGIGACLAVGSAMRVLLFQTAPVNAAALAVVVAVLVAAAALACIIPCRRALHVEPVTALRQD